MKSKLLCLTLLLMLMACQSHRGNVPQNTRDKDLFTDMRVQFIYEDIDPTYWTKPTTGSMFLDVFVFYQGATLDSSAVKEMRIYDNNGISWTKSPDVTPKYVGGWSRSKTAHYSVNYSVLSLSEYTIEIAMADGSVYRRKYDPPDPEIGGSNTKKYVYSVDYKGKKDDEYVQGLRRPQIKESIIENDLIRLVFSVDDHRVKNGYVEFYDKDKKYLARVPQFKNAYSLEIASYLNRGTDLFVDGTDNELTIAQTDLEFSRGRSFSEIKYAIVVLTNGGYPGRMPAQDETIFLSRSGMVPFRLNQLKKKGLMGQFNGWLVANNDPNRNCSLSARKPHL
jgi:hypothetical protein